jgi:hypothetical protein
MPLTSAKVNSARTVQGAIEELSALKYGTKPSPFWLESWDDNKRFYLPPEARPRSIYDPAALLGLRASNPARLRTGAG